MAVIKSFRELDVYRLGRIQAKEIFQLTKQFPKEEIYSLTDQIRRSSRAVNAMIAESWAKPRYSASFISKIDDAMGEAMEAQAWLDHAMDCDYIDSKKHAILDDAWQHISAMLYRMIERADDFCRSAKPGSGNR